MLSSSDLHFLEHVFELFDFECMRKNDRNIYMWKDFNNFRL
jgi:hypothetical protein